MRPEETVGISEEEQSATARKMYCAKLAGRAVTKVVHRCSDAKLTTNLDLSECDLMTVPDAVYHLLRNTRVAHCNLAKNDITKIANKFSHNFSNITTLNLSFNNLGGLPDELSACHQLERLNMSNNSFTHVPRVVFRLPSLQIVVAKKNYIADIEIEKFQSRPHIRELDFTDNPVNASSRDRVNKIPSERGLVVRLSVASDDDSDFDD